MKWSECYQINSHDIDFNGIVRASLILRYFQETANLQLYHLGPTPTELREAGKAFILSKINMSLYKPLYAFDTIRVESWACESKGVSFNRCYRMYKDEKIVAEATSVWALVGIYDKKLYRTSDLVIPFDTDEMLELDAPTRLRIPKDVSLSLLGERAIAYSDLDLNQHMNNTLYPDMLCDFLPTMHGKRVIGLGINFMGEATAKESIKVYGGHSDGIQYFRTMKENGSVGIEAEMLLDDIPIHCS